MPQEYFYCGLNVKGRNCLVIGSDAEAIQKARRLEKAGAVVTRVASANPSELENQFLVVFTDKTDSAQAKALYERAQEKRILFCALDQPRYCDFANVSLFEKGLLKIGISTGGAAPAVARKIREGLEQSFEGNELEEFFHSLSQLRARLEKDIPDVNKRRKVLIDAVSDFAFRANVTFPSSWSEKN